VSGLEAPAIIGIIGAATAVAGTAVSIYSSVKASENAAVAAENEADAREFEAKSAREAAAYQERQFRRRASLLLGKQSATLAASGLDPSQGSPMLAELDAIQQTELEALNIRRTGEVSASSKDFEARLKRQQAGFFQSQIGPTVVGGGLQAGSSILGSWSKYFKASTPYTRDLRNEYV